MRGGPQATKKLHHLERERIRHEYILWRSYAIRRRRAVRLNGDWNQLVANADVGDVLDSLLVGEESRSVGSDRNARQ